MARSGGKRIGSKMALEGKYTYGDAAEIANRDKAGYQPHPTDFHQIGPSDHGGNLNEPRLAVKSGNWKFNPPVR